MKWRSDKMGTTNLEAEKFAIKTILEKYITSVENADIEMYAQNIVHDPNMVNFGTDASDHLVGWNALKKAIEAQNVALSGTKIIASEVTVNISPDARFAWATSLWDFKAMMAGQAIEVPVRCTWILEKKEYGWAIVHFHKSVGMT
jgi:ketosteroid isomerase-like protein